MKEIKWIHSEKMVDNINKIGYPIIVLTGPSGAGKSALRSYIEKVYGNDFAVIKNNVTRKRRSTDNIEDFKYLSESKWLDLKDKDSFFLARYVKFPFYGYLNSDMQMIMNMKKIPLFMLREGGLNEILDLLNNVYVINITSDSEMIKKHSHDETMHLTVEETNDAKNKIESICKLKAKKIITVYNNYDSAFFNNQCISDFIAKIKEDKSRFL